MNAASVRNFGLASLWAVGAAISAFAQSGMGGMGGGAQSMTGTMPGMGSSPMPGPSAAPMPGAMPGMAAAAKPEVPLQDLTRDFREAWKTASTDLKLGAGQSGRLAARLTAASERLAKNWQELETLRAREASASRDALDSIRKRLVLAMSERDLLVSEVELDLKEFLGAAQVELVMTAAFHGVSASHLDGMDAMGMGGMGAMPTASPAAKRLSELAGAMNRGYKAVSIDELARLLAKP